MNEDPRVHGLNYLWIATLPRSEAVRAVDFLASAGRKAIGVPSRVDRSPQAANNPSYLVFLLTGLTREQYGDAGLRVRIENEIKDLGKQWSKGKDRGPSDFSKPGWVKYEVR